MVGGGALSDMSPSWANLGLREIEANKGGLVVSFLGYSR